MHNGQLERLEARGIGKYCALWWCNCRREEVEKFSQVPEGDFILISFLPVMKKDVTLIEFKTNTGSIIRK